MKALSLTLVIASMATAAAFSPAAYSMPAPEVLVEEYQYSDAELDSLLAPIALYPDTLLTHILVSSTYPMDVIEADRWRQKNQHLTNEQTTQAIAFFEWDASVKVIVPFTDILHMMAEDLTWLQRLGDNVLIDEARILQRVQVLRQQAFTSGNLKSTQYLHVVHQQELIVITPLHQNVIYIPYYNPNTIYGRWPHAIAPVYWHHNRHYRHHGLFYWSPGIHISTSFYFGGIQWINRHLFIHSGRVKHNHHMRTRKLTYSKSYQRWQHNQQHRRTRYSHRVVRSAPKAYIYKPAKKLKTIRSSKATHQRVTRQTRNKAKLSPVVTPANKPGNAKQKSMTKTENRKQQKTTKPPQLKQARQQPAHQAKHKVVRTHTKER